MTDTAIPPYADDYADWLRQRVRVREHSGVVAIEVPFLDTHNDYLNFYVRPAADGVELTDSGQMLRDLQMCGVNPDAERHADLIETIARAHGVHLSESGELRISATRETLADRAHSLVQAMLGIAHVNYVNRARAVNTFTDRVRTTFLRSKIDMHEDVVLVGATGSRRHFEFEVPASAEHPRTFVSTLAVRTNAARDQLLFAWMDTEEARGPNAQGLVIVNDRSVPWTTKLGAAMEHYKLRAVKWSEVGDPRAILRRAG